MCRFLLFVFFAFFTFQSFAADTSFVYYQGPKVVYGTSPDSACAGSGNPTWTFSGASSVGDGQWDCRFTFSNEYQTWNFSGGYVFQKSFSCPSSSPYVDKSNSSQWQCTDVAPPDAPKNGDKCADQTGAKGSIPMIYSTKTASCVLATDADDDASCKYMSTIGTGSGLPYTIKGIWDAGIPTAPPTFAQNGLNCEVSTISTSECVTNTVGEVSCNVVGVLTGKATNTSPNTKAFDAECPGGVCPVVQQNTTANNNPCVYSGSSADQSCTSMQETQKDGKQDCGTVNGKTTCIYQQPSSNGIKIDTNVKTTTEADGSKTAVKTDNATKTTCTDVKKCTTTTSTTTTTTKTNSSGVSTSTSSTCTGKCGANGTGLESGGGSGTGTDNGSGGTGDEEGSGGDAGTLKDPENGSFDPQAAEWDEKLIKAKTDFKDSLGKLKTAFQPIGDTGLGSGAGHLYCPPPVVVLGKQIGFCLDEYASSLEWLASAIYAVFAVMALLIIFL